MRKIIIKTTDFLIVFLACIAALIYLIILRPLIWLEYKIYKTKKLDSRITDFITIPPDAIYSGDRSEIYTIEMYNNSHLPPFYFTKQMATRKGLMPFQKGDKYPTYAFDYITLIRYLNQGILTTYPQ